MQERALFFTIRGKIFRKIVFLQKNYFLLENYGKNKGRTLPRYRNVIHAISVPWSFFNAKNSIIDFDSDIHVA